MAVIHHSGSCQAPLSFTFSYLDDYRHATEWMFGLSAFAPVGAQDSGLGAEFAGTFTVKPVSLSSKIRVTEWERDAVIAFASIEGFQNSSTWRFSSDGADRTRVDVEFAYELPGGLAGRVLAKTLEPVAALSVRHTDRQLRECVEKAYAARG